MNVSFGVGLETVHSTEAEEKTTRLKCIHANSMVPYWSHTGPLAKGGRALMHSTTAQPLSLVWIYSDL